MSLPRIFTTGTQRHRGFYISITNVSLLNNKPLTTGKILHGVLRVFSWFSLCLRVSVVYSILHKLTLHRNRRINYENLETWIFGGNFNFLFDFSA
jgi:hypothetical protein